MKKLIIFIAILYTGIAFAQDDKNAEKLLQKVIDHTSSYKNFKANLSYTMVNADINIDEKKTGVIYVEGDNYRIEMEGQVIISDGKTTWTYLSDSDEVMISDVDDSEGSISPTKILTEYNDSYKAKFSTGKEYKNSNLKKICLKPNDKKNFEKMSVVVNVNKLSLESFSVYDVNGNVFTYHIINLQANIKMLPNTFTFNAALYPGVEVVDMR